MKNELENELEFLYAAGAVYAWMCASDGVVTKNESEGFSKYIKELPYINNVSHQDFLKSYAEILFSFEQDFEDGKKKALIRIEPLKFNKSKSQDLIKVARLALVADEKLEEVEEAVLQEICNYLDISESQVA